MKTHVSVLRAGPEPEKASATMVMLHGRGASAESILSLYHDLAGPEVAALAPQAPGHTWYPHSFLAPLASNQPYLDQSLALVESIVSRLPGHRIVILGFSQGACLASEFVARHPRRYGALVAFTGGLIGPPGMSRHDPGDLGGTPVFLGSGDPDPHVPFFRVEETAQVLERMGARVDLRRYPGLGHTVHHDELEAARQLIHNNTKETE